MKGIYCLIIFLNKSQKIRIGKKTGFFPRGYYCYVGSALNNLEKRIERHLRKEKKKRWHIDYFLGKAEIKDIIVLRDSAECKLSKKIENIGGKIVFEMFGSSDCNCKTHLYYFSKNPIKDRNFISLFTKRK